MAEAYPYIDRQTLDLIKYPPLFSPEVSYLEDLDYSSNNLRGKLFQFCYRYKYDTKMKSVFSPYSKVCIPQGEELPNGDFIPNFHLNNALSVIVNMGHHTVEEVEVAYRIGNNGTLYVFDRIKKYSEQLFTGTFYRYKNYIKNIGVNGGIGIADLKEGMMLLNAGGEKVEFDNHFIVRIDIAENTVYLNKIVTFSVTTSASKLSTTQTKIDGNRTTVIFRNDKVDYAVSETERDESFDRVPIEPKAFEVIESNKIVVGDFKSGFDNVVPEVVVTSSMSAKAEYLNRFLFPKNFRYTVSGEAKIFLRIPDSPVTFDYYYLNLRFIDRVSAGEVIITASYFRGVDMTETPEEIVQYLVDTINLKNNLAADDPTKNFKVQSLLNDAIEYPINDYDAVEHNMPGAMVSYNTRIYIAKIDTTHNAPSGTTADNVFWSYFCEVSRMGRALVLRALPLEGDQTYFNYRLSSYGATIYHSSEIFSIFKFGHKQNFAIEYIENPGRMGSANRTDTMAIDIPYIDATNPELFTNAIVNTLTLSILHQPPIWADVYRILIDHNIPWFYQFFFYGFKHATPDIIDDNTHYRIKINRAIQNLRDYLPKSTLAPYIFEKGDRIRLIAYNNKGIVYVGPGGSVAIEIPPTKNVWTKFNTVLDAEIIGYDYLSESQTYLKDDTEAHDYILDAAGNKVRDISSGHIIIEKFHKSELTFDNAIYVVYEIYRPRKTSDENTSYWETHQTFEILNAHQENRSHGGTTPQDPDNLRTSPAIVTISGGTVYRKMRFSGEADVYFPVESLSLSDFYESNAISKGRTNAISEDLGQVHEEDAYAWSESIIEDTGINQLNKFPAKNKDRLQSKNGPITVLHEKGYILYALQPRKKTSIYIGRKSLINPDGTETVKMQTDSVFGTVNPDVSEYGCVDPRSFSASETHCYFWDDNNSKWCRIAYNGVFPITDYGKNKFFGDMNKVMKKAGNRQSLSVYDNKFDELVVSHRYKDGADYTLTVIGRYAIGDSKVTEIGRQGESLITSLEPGMMLTTITSGENTTDTEVMILWVDVPTKTIYLDQPIPFAEGIEGTINVTASIIQKNEMVTMAFHDQEGATGWKTGYPFNPEFMINYGDELLSFINGRTYLHNSDNVPYGHFYGIDFPMWFKFAWSADPNMIKLINGIEILANDRFGMVDKGDVTILSNDNRGIPMESKLPAVRLRNVEGRYVASFLRDMNTPGFANENYALVDGRFLRGQTCILKLTNLSKTKVVMFEVSILFTESK
jgi:hypothetical protein